MFGLEYIAAGMKILFNIAFAIVTAIPFYYCWNCIAPIYLSNYIPTSYQNIPYWHTVAILLLLTFIGEQIQKVTPKLVSVSQSNN